MYNGTGVCTVGDRYHLADDRDSRISVKDRSFKRF